MSTYDPETLRLGDGRVITIRHCAADDAPLLSRHQEVLAQETDFTLMYPGMRAAATDQVAKRWSDAEKEPGSLYLGAFSDARLVGQLMLFQPQKDHPWFKHTARFAMNLEKEFWGQGIARRFAEIMESHARSVGIRRIEADVDCENGRAIRFYEKCGFAIEGTRRAAGFLGGRYRDQHYIAKLLL